MVTVRTAYPDPREDVLMRCVSSDGTTVVEVIHLSCTGSGRDGAWYRVRRDQWRVADVRCLAELVTLGIEQERPRSERIAVVPVWTSTV